MNKLSDMQLKLLSLLDAFHKICEENGLKYYAVFGTFLGAVRHNGFIPWDDDVDVAMPRKDYEKLKLLMEGKTKPYVFETASDKHKDFGYCFGKFYDCNTTLQERSSLKTVRGIYLDVFQLDDAGDTLEQAKVVYKSIKLKKMILQSRLFPMKKGRGFIKNFASFITRLIPFYSPNKAANKLDRIAATNSGSRKYQAVFLGTEDFEHCVFSRSIYGKPVLYKFENIMIYGPSKGIEYLKKVFGDWETLPPVQMRVCRHDFLQLDLNRPYLEDK